MASTSGIEDVPGPFSSTAELRWFVVVRRDADPIEDASAPFTRWKNDGFLWDLGIAGSLPVPSLLHPTNRFEQALARVLRKAANVDLRTSRFPFELELPTLGHCHVDIPPPRLYPGVVAFSLRATPSTGVSVTDLTAAQTAHNQYPLRDLIAWSCGVICSSKIRHIPRVEPTVVHPALILKGCPPLSSEETRRVLAAAVIRDDPAVVAGHVIDAIWEKNHHNKWSDAAVLIDRQGFLFASESTRPNAARTNRLRRSLELYELGLVAKATAEKNGARDRPPEELMRGFVRLANSPAEAFRGSVSSEATWRLISSEFKLALDFPERTERRFPLGSVAASVAAALIVAILLGAWNLVR